MNRPSELSDEEFARRLADLRVSGAAGSGSEEVGEARWFLRDAGALLGCFRATSLRPGGTRADDGALRAFIDRDCRPVRTADGSRWQLKPEIRTEALNRFDSVESMVRSLYYTEPDPVDVERRMATAYLSGTAPGLYVQSADQLSGTSRFVEWVEAAPRARRLLTERIAMPARADIESAVGVATVLGPLRALAGEGFVGRERELAVLEDYVGVLPPRSLKRAVVRNVRSAITPGPGLPLFLHGPGGVGKSTLVARFVLDHAGMPGARPIPFVYLSFDRTDLLPGRPLTLVAEAVRQLGLMYPEVSGAARKLEESVRAALRREVSVLGDGDHREPVGLRSSRRDEQELIADFAALARRATGGPPGPLLLVVDTVERAQRLGEAVLRSLWDTLDFLQFVHPSVRLVLAGRAPVLQRKVRTMEIKGFEPEVALDYLHRRLRDVAVTEADDKFLRRVIATVGTVPLSLKLAADLIRREGPVALETRRRILFRLPAEQVQGVLYQRILDELGDEDLRRIASPGLTVRRVTPEVIRKVLARPCGLGRVDEARARALFRGLAAEASLVEPVPGEEAVVHRADVRRVMLPLLYERYGQKVERINREAVEYYLAREGPEARAEQLYHRLALGQPTAVLDEHWSPEAAPLLESALDELPPTGRVYLADRLGLVVTPEVRAAADDEAWVRQAVRIARELLDAGRSADALAVLGERPALGLRPGIAAPSITALARTGQADRAVRLAQEALCQSSEAGNRTGFADLTVLGARVLEDRERFAEALDWLREAEPAAAEAGGRWRRLENRVARLRLYRRTGAGESPEARRLRSEVIGDADSVGRRKWADHPALVHDLAAEAGEDLPALVAMAAGLVGIRFADDTWQEVLATEVSAASLRDFMNAVAAPSDGRPPEQVPRGSAEADPLGDLLDWAAARTGAEQGLRIAAYLDGGPEHGRSWIRALVQGFRYEVDSPAIASYDPPGKDRRSEGETS
ncbi:AAA family ATPase [Kitasatospora misakiensis]|uniref:AAA family ATPase n=1 Tax=Kitasatospora misakiensis TaxID=67330 RepID=A0ABW0X880_9ACTN